MLVPFHFVDVFATVALTGNPLVVVEGDGLAVEQMQALAAEFNQSETTFVLSPTLPGAHFRLRSFTPRGIEVFGAGGHNTLGAWWWLADSGRLSLSDGDNSFSQEIGGEVFPLSVTARDGKPLRVRMPQQKAELGKIVADRNRLAGSLGLAASQFSELPAQVVSTGVAHLMVPLRDRAAVDAATASSALLLGVLHEVGAEGCYIASIEPETGDIEAYARFFNPTVGIIEDPATGTAAGPLAAYIAARGLHNGPTVRIEQGRLLGRPSIIEVELTADSVAVSAQCVVAGSGALRL